MSAWEYAAPTTLRVSGLLLDVAEFVLQKGDVDLSEDVLAQSETHFTPE